MRVGMILDKSFPPDPRVENEALALIEAQHTVFLFCLSFDGSTSSEVHQEIHLRRIPCSQFVYKLSALAYTVPWYTSIMAKKIRQFIEENDIELLHIHDMRIAAAALRANETFRLPTILDLHENLPEIMKFYRHVQQFPGSILISPTKWKKKEEELINKVSKVVVVTDESKADIIKRVGVDSSKVVAVPNTVRASFYQEAFIEPSILQKYSDSFVLLYIGDTALRRGLSVAIKAVALLKEELPDLQLVIVGNGSADHILKQQVNELNVADAVRFEGWQDPSLFPSYITASAIGISPLDRNVHHDTTYANKLFQYMSFSKPVLVSDATAQKNLVEATQSGLVHKEKDAHDFADKVRTLYRDTELIKQMGVRAKEVVVSQFNWKVSVQGLLDLYDEIKT